MKFEGTVETQASRQEVWRFLSDPAAVGRLVIDLHALRPQIRAILAAVVSSRSRVLEIGLQTMHRKLKAYGVK